MGQLVRGSAWDGRRCSTLIRPPGACSLLGAPAWFLWRTSRQNRRKRLGIVDKPQAAGKGFFKPHFAHAVRTVRSKAQPLLDKIPAARLPFADKIPFLNRSRRTWHTLEGSDKADVGSIASTDEK